MSKRKEQLLQQGLKDLVEKGPNAISLRALANSCQLTHAACYRHFANKEELIKALLPLVSEDFYQHLKREDSTAPRERIIDLAEAFIRYAKDKPFYFDFLFLGDYAPTVCLEEGKILPSQDLASFSYIYEQIQNFHQSLTEPIPFDQLFLQLWSYILGLALIIRQESAPIKNPRALITSQLAAFN